MRLIDAESLTALEGSRPADTLTVWAWRGWSLVLPEPLEVINWSFQDDTADKMKVGQRISLTVADPDGSLGAWRLGDPLGVAGSRLQVIYRVGGGGAVNYGWFRIVGNSPDEVWESRVIDEYGYLEPDGTLPEHKRRVFVSRAVVKLEAVDLTFNVDLDKLESPESPSTPTVLGEFRRLTANHFPTVVESGVTDTDVSPQLVFDRERLEACQDLLGRVNARYRMGGDGECRVYPRTSAPVWRVEPGAGLVNVTRSQSVDGLHNRWVVEGKTSESGEPVRGVVSIESGDLMFGGPNGRVQEFYTSEMITSDDQAVAYGKQLRDEFLGSLAVRLTVETVPRPELQAGDWVEVGCPLPAGHVVYLPGAIESIRRSGNPVPQGTTLTVSCSYADVLKALSTTPWAVHLTGNLPPLTWNRMPGTWGAVPSMTWNDLP